MADFTVACLLWMIVTVALVSSTSPSPCLTGTASDVQSWVSESGELTRFVDPRNSVDVSAQPRPMVTLFETLASMVRNGGIHVQYLSLARNGLTRIPAIFDDYQDTKGFYLANTLEYLTLFGNNFIEVSQPGEEFDEFMNATDALEIRTAKIHRGESRAMWSASFQRVAFRRLRELDLRACGIIKLDSNIFQNVPTLKALYLSDNYISIINANAFNGLRNLIHLDLSRNNGFKSNEYYKHLIIETDNVFANLENLKSLDLSHTSINPTSVSALKSIGRQLERLSICYLGNFKLDTGFFSNTSLKILDISGNQMILSNRILKGLEKTLRVLYASEVGLKNFSVFHNFTQLEILKVNNNEIATVDWRTTETLSRLQWIDLRRNRITNWSKATYSLMPALQLLDLRINTINVINEVMINDLRNTSYLAMSDNPMVCNCHSRDFIELAARNEINSNKVFLKPLQYRHSEFSFNFHRGFLDVNDLISRRQNMSQFTSDNKKIELVTEGNFVLIDYDEKAYSCLKLPQGDMIFFAEVQGCHEMKGVLDDKLVTGRRHLLALLIIPGLLLPAMFFGYLYRRNLRYFCIMIRNSAMLSMVNENKVINDDTIFNYDVFVSYCNEDRPWVLDQLLSHLENDCSVSLCLHERDFQVGLSILENIVCCMDRSKVIMLVISKQFLRSQWCQFEMHLAQHRLLETRREDLILILLEDIPRRIRPNTLHYLMLTKTYIVWPKNKAEQQVFWKRLKKSVTTQRQREDGVSLA